MTYITNAGAFNRKIVIFKKIKSKDSQGFPTDTLQEVLTTWANVKTTKGFTLIKNNSDFEKAFTNFTIRFPKVEIDREMIIQFKGKTYTIEYINNVNESNVELEIQAKEVTH